MRQRDISLGKLLAQEFAKALFTGSLSKRSVGRLLHGTKATWVLADCKTTGDLDRELGKHVVSVQRFGCAAVYRVD